MRRALLVLFWCCAIAALCLAGPQSSAIPWVADEEIIEELRRAPQTDRERAERLSELLRQGGVVEVRTQTITPSRAGSPEGADQFVNVVAELPGRSETRIVVGAHTDFTKVGRGVIDDWSGAAMLVNVAQTLVPLQREHTFVFVGFTLEEGGLVGSGYYVRHLSRAQRGKIRAMVNLECLGVSRTFVWRTGSADALEALAARVASDYGADITIRGLLGVAADSDSFMRAGIPAITFDSLSKEDFRLIDSPGDRLEAIDRDVYLTQYRFLVHYLLALDQLTGPVDAANRDRAHLRVTPGFELDMDRLRSEGVVVVARVFEGSPEYGAGLKVGDIIVTFAGVAIMSPEFSQRFARLTVGEKVTATVTRDGTRVDLEIQY